MPENASIVGRIAKLEAEIEMLKGEWLNIPDLIEMRFRRTDSRIARTAYELSNHKREMATFKDEMIGFKDEMTSFKEEMAAFRRETNERFDKLESTVVGMPRLIIDMLDERERRRR